MDQDYLEGFYIAQTKNEFRHGPGNMGKLGSFTQEEMDRKKEDNRKLVEIWQKSV
jgi:O-succinylbenzoate synthase